MHGLLVHRLFLIMSLFAMIPSADSFAAAVPSNNGNANIDSQKVAVGDSGNTAGVFTGVRFSLYPNVAKEDPPSMKQAVKDAVRGLKDLGVAVIPDDVSSVLIGPEPVLFEALRLCFAQASVRPDGQARHVSMQCTFSSGCPGEDPDQLEIPERTVETEGDGAEDANDPSRNEFVSVAYQQPPRIAAQFAVYPLGLENHMEIIYDVIGHAKQSSVWKGGKTHFCSMLDGDGNTVFDVLRSSFAVARERGGGHVVMTATITANKNAWPDKDKTGSLGRSDP